ncbi:MAG: DUF3471 domain-containing protein, partial [Sinobacteraceae bacterium]|nr:DUF3471 domain-containing protein [Nevskiaceae bacterium]
AAQKQLGLQIVPQDGDVKYMVVDHIEQPSNLVPPPKAVTIQPNVFDRYVGHYAFPGYAVMTVSRDGDRFLTQVTGQPQLQIFATSDREFFAKAIDVKITFVPNDEGVATQLVVHQNGQDITAPRITDAAVKAREEALAQRVRDQKAAPGSEAMLRKQIEALQHDQPDYDDMTSTFAGGVRAHSAEIHAPFAGLGQVRSVTFTGVGPGGADIYQVQFDKAAFEIRIMVDTAGKVDSLFFKRTPAS